MLFLPGGNIAILTPLKGDLVLAANNAMIVNTVAGSARAVVGRLTLLPNAKLEESLMYMSESKVDVQPGVTIFGTITQTIPEKIT